MYDVRCTTDPWVQRVTRRWGKVHHLRRRFIHWACFIVHCTLLTSCLSSRRLPDNQYLLYTQTVKGNELIEDDELLELIPQRPNKRFLQSPFTISLWIYQAFSGNYRPDSARRELEVRTARFEQESQNLINNPKALRKLNRRFSRQARHLQRYIEGGNWVMRNFGEPPVYYAAADAQSNTLKMQRYLQSKGFFRAKTGFSVDTLLDRRVRVNYLITEDLPYTYATVRYQIPDRRIDSLVGYSLANSLLKVGARYDADNLENERIRIEELLRNNGYYGFSRQYIRYEVARDSAFIDSAFVGSQPVDLTVQLANPPGQTAHPIYRIGDVQMTVARDTKQPLDTIAYNRITYLLERGLYRPRLLDTKISLRPGDLYRQNAYNATQRQLFLLNQFRFSNVNFTDTTNRRLRTVITATPLDKYDATVEGGATGLYQTQSLYPGGFGNLSLRVRNLFGGLETFETSVRFGIEAQTGFIQIDSVYSSREFGLTNSLTFPQILFPGRLRFRFNELNPRTQVSLGYTSISRPEYSRQNLRLAMTYLWQKNQAQQFTLSPADINYLRASRIASTFEEFLKQQDAQGNPIRTSFQSAFFSSINAGYTYNTNVVGQNRRANFLRVTGESGGTTLNLISNRAIERLADQTGLRYFKYLRTNIDYRHYLPVGVNSVLAFRANGGLVVGYGPDRTAPYEKRFFAGGANSVRAWLPRRLGWGAAYPQSGTQDTPLFREEEGGAFDYRFERPGDVLLEGSAELRGRLIKFGSALNLDGAAFVDVGNVWLLRRQSSSTASTNLDRGVFQPGTFLEQLAVGTGVGIRFDFSFVILRLDAAVKVYDPARRYVASDGRLVDERFILPKFSFGNLASGPNPVVLNFGIGYPF
ncbi:hypothetical protein FAES_2503 [Fibrella aestuarina BUZ 2]|uniref:Bacterial surface antigen (D15) domain-containing protein n=1 Tax=Fibrella aestuarina BUZ 2 TaxID=1166018 RepID=I0K8Q9_9BACT|nr:BamA/TamA family outer membrane protein [Fibrella aestuarina]CCH00512.1 hypothetical protein FAES_2503 [Fibrella aestuarina BUZ 2]